MTDYQRIDIALRDQTATKDAHDGFQQFIIQFPKSQYLKQAKQKLNECRFELSKNIFVIGKFYYRTGAYHSAISRFTNLLTDHPKQKFFEEAAFLLAESHYHEQSFKEALSLYKEFTKKYPRSRFAPEIKKRLRTLK
jgi:outer membrane protein assembly factor BamD